MLVVRVIVVGVVVVGCCASCHVQILLPWSLVGPYRSRRPCFVTQSLKAYCAAPAADANESVRELAYFFFAASIQVANS